MTALHDAAEMDMLEADQRREQLLAAAREVGGVRAGECRSGGRQRKTACVSVCVCVSVCMCVWRSVLCPIPTCPGSPPTPTPSPQERKKAKEAQRRRYEEACIEAEKADAEELPKREEFFVPLTPGAAERRGVLLAVVSFCCGCGCGCCCGSCCAV